MSYSTEPETYPEEQKQPLLSLGALLGGLRLGWRLGTAIMAVSLVLGIYILATREALYSANTMIEPPVSSGPQMSGSGQLLASIAGIGSSGNADQFTKYMHVIGSIRLAHQMDQDHQIARHYFQGWDEETHSWKPPSGTVADIKAWIKSLLGLPPWHAPDDAALAQVLNDVTSVNLVPGRSPLDLRSQVFAISVTDADRAYAESLLRWMLADADALVRQDELGQTSNRIAYLNTQILSTNEVMLRASLQTLLMSQQQTMMTLKTDKFYAIDLMDPPFASDLPIGMPGSKLLLLMLVLGASIYVTVVAAIVVVRSRRGEDPLATPFPGRLDRLWRRRRH